MTCRRTAEMEDGKCRKHRKVGENTRSGAQLRGENRNGQKGGAQGDTKGGECHIDARVVGDQKVQSSKATTRGKRITCFLRVKEKAKATAQPLHYQEATAQ